jgi:hypothetical protein
VNAVPSVAYRSDAKRSSQKLRELMSDLRHVERQRDPPRQATITLSTDWDIEASLTVDESTDPMT